MRLKSLLLLICIAHAIVSQSQNDDFVPTLTIGDPAPQLRVEYWLKRGPVKSFEKGKIYVIEFWATWCTPCKAAMPRLSVLARKYRNDVTVIGVDVNETRSKKFIQNFVDSMGDRIDYLVAKEESNFMNQDWLEASGEPGMPGTFIVDKKGEIAWIGHPQFLDKVLQQVVDGTWNNREARTKRKSDKELHELDLDAMHELTAYRPNPMDTRDDGQPDSALARINMLTAQDPRLTYTPFVAYNTYAALLKTQPQKAYEYGRKLMSTGTHEESPLYILSDVLKNHSSSFSLPAGIYLLGAEALEIETCLFPYPELINIAKRYDQIAEWYWKAEEPSKAIEAQQKAIRLLKLQGRYSTEELNGFEFRLEQYKNTTNAAQDRSQPAGRK